ncbi:MAG: hypothetical protein JWM19_4505 [Actinomycetia bacterium]|nr:hypothetical protein [Actinomycetes bacterium]
MNAENPVQINLFGVSATHTKDARLAEHIGGYMRGLSQRVSHVRYRRAASAALLY